MKQTPHGQPIRQLSAAQRRRAHGSARHPNPARRQAWRSALPWFIMTASLASVGVVLVVIGQVVAHVHQQVLTETLTPVGVMLLATSSAPLVLGVVRLLAVEQPPATHRCGRCQFYRPASGTYTHGLCMVDRHIQMTFRTEHCERFAYSERAMVRDRLSDAPHILDVTQRPSNDA